METKRWVKKYLEDSKCHELVQLLSELVPELALIEISHGGVPFCELRLCCPLRFQIPQRHLQFSKTLLLKCAYQHCNSHPKCPPPPARPSIWKTLREGPMCVCASFVLRLSLSLCNSRSFTFPSCSPSSRVRSSTLPITLTYRGLFLFLDTSFECRY